MGFQKPGLYLLQSVDPIHFCKRVDTRREGCTCVPHPDEHKYCWDCGRELRIIHDYQLEHGIIWPKTYPVLAPTKTLRTTWPSLSLDDEREVALSVTNHNEDGVSVIINGRDLWLAILLKDLSDQCVINDKEYNNILALHGFLESYESEMDLMRDFIGKYCPSFDDEHLGDFEPFVGLVIYPDRNLYG